MDFGEKIEQEIKSGQDRTDNEHSFHKAIAKGVTLSAMSQKAVIDTVNDRRMIMDFLEQKNAEGAKNAMKIHIMHAIQELGIEQFPTYQGLQICKSSFFIIDIIQHINIVQ